MPKCASPEFGSLFRMLRYSMIASEKRPLFSSAAAFSRRWAFWASVSAPHAQASAAASRTAVTRRCRRMLGSRDGADTAGSTGFGATGSLPTQSSSGSDSANVSRPDRG